MAHKTIRSIPNEFVVLIQRRAESTGDAEHVTQRKVDIFYALLRLFRDEEGKEMGLQSPE